jgi:hypothetical protein
LLAYRYIIEKGLSVNALGGVAKPLQVDVSNGPLDTITINHLSEEECLRERERESERVGVRQREGEGR